MSDLIALRGAKGGEGRAITKSNAWFRIDRQPWMIGRDYHVGKAMDVTDTTFEPEVLRSKLPVLIGFWAPWCGPCKAIAPIVRERAKEKGFNFPYLFDESQSVARAYGAERTPDVFLFDKRGQLRYHGAIDDNYDDPGAVKDHYLRNALDAVLGTTPLAVATTHHRGCTIKWK